MNVGAYKPGIGGEILPGQQFKQHSVYPAGEGEQAPAWLAFDRQVLSFDAYFHESVVPTISREGFRIRPVKGKCVQFFKLKIVVCALELGHLVSIKNSHLR